jgi:DNA-binding transcriptional ArsR family regulator
VNDGDLLDEVRVRPGAHKSELMRSLGVSWGTLGRGLKRLESQGQVMLVRLRQRTRAYLPHEFPAHVLRGSEPPAPVRLVTKQRTQKATNERQVAVVLAPAQRRLVEVVAARPGLTKSDLCRELDLAWGTVSYHIRVLGEQGLLALMRDGRQLRLYPPGTRRREMRWLAVLSDEVPELIARSLMQGPGRLVEIARRVGRSRTLVRHHMTSLGEAGVVDKDGQEYRLREVQGLLQYLHGPSDETLSLLDCLKEEQ